MSDKLVTETARHYAGQMPADKGAVNILVAVERETMAWTWQNIRDTVRGLRDVEGRSDADIIALLLGEYEGE